MIYICNVKLRQTLFEMLEMKRLSRKQFGILYKIIKDVDARFLDNIGRRFVDISYDFRFGRAKVAVTYMAKCTYNFGEAVETLNTLIQFDCMFEQDGFPDRYVARPMEVTESDHHEANIFDFLACPLKVDCIKLDENEKGLKGGVLK